MASLWRRTAHAMDQDDHDDDSSSSSSSKKGKAKKGKKRSSDDAGINDVDDQAAAAAAAFAPPDCTVTIGSGEGATSLRADRFVLASRSEFFRACLDKSSSFQEGASGQVTLDVPAPMPSGAAVRGLLEFFYTGSLSSSSSSSLSANDALDVLHITGQSDEGGGYLQLRDNEKLRSQARALIAAGLEDGSAFSLLRRVHAMGQQEAKGPIMGHVMKAGCGARPTDGAMVDEEGAWAASEEWWNKDQEIAMCHEVIGELIAAREE